MTGRRFLPPDYLQASQQLEHVRPGRGVRAGSCKGCPPFKKSLTNVLWSSQKKPLDVDCKKQLEWGSTPPSVRKMNKQFRNKKWISGVQLLRDHWLWGGWRSNAFRHGQ